ncbi:MAG TPA: alkaline phosphatase family protein [Thermoanaerobaculia bacterium]
MPDRSVDTLRQQLRERGYLSHGIERWFALDPWRSRAFWLELATVAAKAGLLVALFAVLPLVAVMLIRNHPLTAWETLALALMYGVTAFAVSTTLLVVIALVLRLRPALAVDTPRALLGISFTASALLTAPIALWWAGFGAPPSWPELFTGLALIVVFFLMVTVAVSAALLSFSIYELQRVPALHAKPRGVPMSIAAAILIAILFLPTYFVQDSRASAAEPLQVVTRPANARVALIAVDGLTLDVFRAHPTLGRAFAGSAAAAPTQGRSSPERWASVGTGVPPALHGVRAVEGVRIRGGRHLIQFVSAADPILHNAGRREPLPPTVRRRDYVWEVFAGRGVPVAAVNWWTTDSQPLVFAAARGDALRVDATASRMLLNATGPSPRARGEGSPAFATVYLPALDIILNRLSVDSGTKLALSVRAIDAVADLVAEVKKRGYDVILIGLPGDRQSGAGVVAATFATPASANAYDVAPTLCALFGFPATQEMPGRSIASTPELPRIATFGRRAARAEAGKVNDEYYKSLKSLGYIR